MPRANTKVQSMCNSIRQPPVRTAKHAVQQQSYHEDLHETLSPTGVMDRQIFHDDEKNQPGAGGINLSTPEKQHDSKKNPTIHDDNVEGINSSRSPQAQKHVVPRSISITSSGASSTTSATDRIVKATLARHNSSSSLSSLSSFGSTDENPSPKSTLAPATAPSKTDESKSPISPRRAIFDSYWKKCPTPPSSHQPQSQPGPASKPISTRDAEDEERAEDPLPAKPAVHVSLPPPPPLVHVEDDDTAKAFFGIVDEPTREYKPRAKRSGSLSDILGGLLGIVPPISASPSATSKPSTKSTSSPRSHLTRTGLMLAHQASCGSSSRMTTLSPPPSPQTPRPKVAVSTSHAMSPSSLSPSPLPSCLRQGSCSGAARTSKHTQDEERTCDSTPSSSSEHLLEHISTDRKEPIVRIRSDSTVSFCPNVHIIEFDNSRDRRDEEIIRSPRAPRKEGTEDWSDWFAA